MAIRIQQLTRYGVKMIERKLKSEHRRYHLAEAKRIRETAESHRIMLMKMATNAGAPQEVFDEIEVQYNNMLSEAIAEENSKCMDGAH